MNIGNFFDKLAGAKEPKRTEQVPVQASEVSVGATPKKRPVSSLPFTKTVLAVAVIAASFYAGFGMGKNQQVTSSPNTNGSSSQSQSQNNTSNGFGSGGMGSNGGFGGPSTGSGFNNGNGGYGRFGGASISTAQVTAISSTSISVKDSSGNSSTYSISSNTLIVDNGTQVATTDIQTGDTVLILPERTDTSIARRILVNPDFDQSQGQGNSQSQPVTIDPSQTQVN